MADWACRLGLIVPSGNSTMEYECWRMAPAGVSIHTSRISHTESSEAASLHTAEAARLHAASPRDGRRSRQGLIALMVLSCSILLLTW